jgi:leucyl-tRNA synthetase
LRHGPKNSFHDKVFEQEVNNLINITQSHYEAYVALFRDLWSSNCLHRTNYKDALKFGFYELQSARDWYREVTSDVGMHADLAMYWIKVAALLITPIAPHFSEHVYSTVLKNPTSVQSASWPTPSESVDQVILDAGQYMRDTIKTIRDAEIALVRMMNKSKGKKGAAPSFDPKQPKAVRIYVATKFPEWQDTCVDAVQQSYDEKTDKVDDEKVRTLLTEKGLIKDKRVMPFVQVFKVDYILPSSICC